MNPLGTGAQPGPTEPVAGLGVFPIMLPMEILKKAVNAGIMFLAVVTVGTVGYRILGGPQYSFLECIYMTVITISTIGFREVVDVGASPSGMIFTMFVAISGIGFLTYLLSTVTALVVEAEIKESFKRRKMDKVIAQCEDHYIICGIGWVGLEIVRELHATGRKYVVVEMHGEQMEWALERFPDLVYVTGDATDEEILHRAGLDKARGLFAATREDQTNLVIALTSKQATPSVRVIARCRDPKNVEKMRKAGADTVVCPNCIGGLRMASEMIRPTVVSFLDMMLRDSQANLRVEEAPVGRRFMGRALSDLELHAYPQVLLLAVRTGEEWIYNPPPHSVLNAGDRIVFLGTPQDREKLHRFLMRD